MEGRRPAAGGDFESASPHDFELHIVGDGAIRPQLESLAAKLALADHVEFHGFVPQDQCAKLLAGFDALVLPSPMSAAAQWCSRRWQWDCRLSRQNGAVPQTTSMKTADS